MSDQTQRLAQFEKIAGQHYLLQEMPLDREDGEYVESELQLAWEVFNAALDSVVVELPNKLHAKPYACYEGGWNDALLETADLIEGMGLKVKS